MGLKKSLAFLGNYNKQSADRVQMEYEREIMLKDDNPDFKKNVENMVLNKLTENDQRNGPYNSAPKSTKSKLINWKIINHGKQTIIVL